MMMDPYQVLGVQPGASQDEIKRAYRRKAKENHPDLHPDDPQAEQRMNEINQAYDMLMNPEKYQQPQSGAGYDPFSQGYGQNPYSQNPFGQGAYGPGWQTVDFGDLFGFGGFGRATERAAHQSGESEGIRYAVDAINARQYRQAALHLNNIEPARRDARWYYLTALMCEGSGNTMQALQAIRQAVQMEPGNPDYQRTRSRMEQPAQTYQQQGRQFGMNPFGISSWCTTMCLANLLCNACCGGTFFWC